MSDFLVSLGRRYNGKDLLELIKKPYGKCAPEGQFFDFPWGSVAVLRERIANDNNIFRRNDLLLAWIGDLIVGGTLNSDRSIERLTERIITFHGSTHELVSLSKDETFEKLNGAFAILLADNNGLSIVTDPLNFTPVFMGRKKEERIAAFGSHSDLVASISGNSSKLDAVSVAEFLNIGTPSFPHTMYENVEELKPGSLHCLSLSHHENQRTAIRSVAYWSPPKELKKEYDENELAEELRSSFLSAVRDRCKQGKVAILLSGGLDSRLIMASVPTEVDCIGLTFCDYFNRETRTARKVAKCYNRAWYPLFRDKEYIADNIIKTINFTGCEYDWIHAHSVGFHEEINKHKINTLFNGAWVGCFLRAPLAEEFVRVNRLGGILPALYIRKPVEYVDRFTPFLLKEIKENMVERVRERRQNFFERTFQAGRGSVKEWLDENPITQRPEICCWNVERRLFPAKAVAADRRILNIAFKCPVELKLGDRIFVRAAMRLYGDGASIINANDGVRPGRGHLWRLLQRSVRKLQDSSNNILVKLGKKPRIQHSWHDYQRYWRESTKLNELIQEYGKNLERVEGTVFEGRSRELLECKNSHWSSSFRLLQLAIWLNVKKIYKLA